MFTLNKQADSEVHRNAISSHVLSHVSLVMQSEQFNCWICGSENTARKPEKERKEPTHVESLQQAQIHLCS